MKKKMCLLLALLAVMISSCAGEKKESSTEIPAEETKTEETKAEGAVALRDGLFVLQGSPDEDAVLSPYISFNTKNMTWRCSQGIAFSFGIDGTFTMEGNRILATNMEGASFEIQILSPYLLKAEKVDVPPFPDDSYQPIREGCSYAFCMTTDVSDAEKRFQTVSSAEEALKTAKDSETVVFKDLQCISGQEIWDAFYRSVSIGLSGRVLCAQYYTESPVLFYYLIEYDGQQYSLKVRESSSETLDADETYACLLHFTGENARGYYDNYVLADDPEATWEGILAGMVSSQFGAGYRHFIVYQNWVGFEYNMIKQ